MACTTTEIGIYPNNGTTTTSNHQATLHRQPNGTGTREAQALSPLQMGDIGDSRPAEDRPRLELELPHKPSAALPLPLRTRFPIFFPHLGKMVMVDGGRRPRRTKTRPDQASARSEPISRQTRRQRRLVVRNGIRPCPSRVALSRRRIGQPAPGEEEIRRSKRTRAREVGISEDGTGRL